MSNKTKPYCVVLHCSGRWYVLNRLYDLIPYFLLPLHGLYCPSGNVKSTYEHWQPTRDKQKPKWARNLPDNQFQAIWFEE